MGENEPSSLGDALQRSVVHPVRRGTLGRLWHDVLYVVGRERKWWLLPLILVLLAAVFLLIAAAAAGPLAPFIYPLM